MKSLKLDAVVLDTPDTKLLAEFYAKLLGWKIDFINEKTVSRISSPDGGTRILFQLNDIYEKPVWPEELGKPQQQAHLDFEVENQEEMKAAIKHALACGATMANKQYGHEEKTDTDQWITLIDPVGHPFCFVIW